MRVLWRFKLLVAAGLAIAVALAFISVFRVDLSDGAPKLVYRDQAVWASSSTLFVTQEGFPWGRSILDETVRVQAAGGTPTYVPRYGDSGRYSGLAQLYVEFAKSDAVRRAVFERAPSGATYQPDVVKSADGSTVLPLIYMSGFGPTPEAAVATANTATAAFRSFLAEEQERNAIPADKRVRVVVMSKASEAKVFAPRSNTRPIFIFLLVFGAVVALVFVLENLRPRVIAPREVETIEPHSGAARRSA